MMPLPIAFRVIRLNAEEGGSHRATIQEVRRPMLAQSTGPRGPEAPPSTLLLEVTPEQFSALRIGQTFSLIPDAEEKSSELPLRDALARQSAGYVPGLR